MSEKPSLTLIAQPQEYFRGLITAAMGRQQVSTRPEIEFYLVNLLNQFITTDRLFARDASGMMREEPLALLIKEAIEAPVQKTQETLFRHVGDLSLYMAGFFQESLARKAVDVDYYIGMGGVAYQNAASRSDEEPLRSVYAELGERFGTFVDVLGEVSTQTAPRSETDLLRLYELWVRTKSERAAKALQEAGILPNETVKKDWQ